jgi:hypothetical protein
MVCVPNYPAVQHPSAQNTSRSSGRQLADVLGTIVLLVAHFLFFGATIMLLGLLVMTTDPCGYQKCGDPAWLDRAMNVNLWAGGAILFADVVITVIRLSASGSRGSYRSSAALPSWQWPSALRRWNRWPARSSP